MTTWTNDDLVRKAAAAKSKAMGLFNADPETIGKGATGSKNAIYPITPVAYAATVAADWFAVVKALGPIVHQKYVTENITPLAVIDFFADLVRTDADDCAQALEDTRTLDDVAKCFGSGDCARSLAGNPLYQFAQEAGLGAIGMAFALTLATRQGTNAQGPLLTPSAAVTFWDGVSRIAISASSQQIRVTAAEKWDSFKQGAAEGVQNVIDTAITVTTAVAKTAGEISFEVLKPYLVPLAAVAVIVWKFKII